MIIREQCMYYLRRRTFNAAHVPKYCIFIYECIFCVLDPWQIECDPYANMSIVQLLSFCWIFLIFHSFSCIQSRESLGITAFNYLICERYFCFLSRRVCVLAGICFSLSDATWLAWNNNFEMIRCTFSCNIYTICEKSV